MYLVHTSTGWWTAHFLFVTMHSKYPLKRLHLTQSTMPPILCSCQLFCLQLTTQWLLTSNMQQPLARLLLHCFQILLAPSAICNQKLYSGDVFVNIPHYNHWLDHLCWWVGLVTKRTYWDHKVRPWLRLWPVHYNEVLRILTSDIYFSNNFYLIHSGTIPGISPKCSWISFCWLV